MEAFYRSLFPLMWAAWALYWTLSARNAKATARREPLWSRLAHIGPLILAAWLLAARHMPGGWLEEPLPFAGLGAYWTGAVLAVLGFAITAWARVHLGRNWSGTVTVKQGHELVRSGPYAWARHPIYTGLLLALVGSALARGEWRGVLALAIAFAALWRKLRLEERWMGETFGAAYEAYKREVKALVPGLL
jgi:protein-S-isoprenylcysteine O-methyltransferase Ste14